LNSVERGDVYHVDLNPTQGREQAGARYVVSEPRVLDLQARQARFIERVPDFILDEVLAKSFHPSNSDQR